MTRGNRFWGAIPPLAELAVGRVLSFGAQKYARDNWRSVEDAQTRYMDAALRHLNAVRRGEVLDSESGEPHLAHAACCVLFMLDLMPEVKPATEEPRVFEAPEMIPDWTFGEDGKHYGSDIW